MGAWGDASLSAPHPIKSDWLRQVPFPLLQVLRVTLQAHNIRNHSDLDGGDEAVLPYASKIGTRSGETFGLTGGVSVRGCRLQNQVRTSPSVLHQGTTAVDMGEHHLASHRAWRRLSSMLPVRRGSSPLSITIAPSHTEGEDPWPKRDFEQSIAILAWEHADLSLRSCCTYLTYSVHNTVFTRGGDLKGTQQLCPRIPSGRQRPPTP